MSNMIRLNDTAPNDQWIVMSNQGTDCFLDLLLTASRGMRKTEHQKKLICFLKDQKAINDIAPGTAGFDLDEMPWREESLREDTGFLLHVAEEAESQDVFQKLPYEADRETVLPWLRQFGVLVRMMSACSKRSVGV